MDDFRGDFRSRDLVSITDRLCFVAQQKALARLLSSFKQSELLREFIAGVDQTLSDYQVCFSFIYCHGDYTDIM